MPDSVKLVKAELHQIDLAKPEDEATTKVAVQFNPETLKVAFANQIQAPEGAGDQRGSPAQQFVGAGTTKLTLQLWFDVNAPQEGEAVNDVRKMTEKITHFIIPKPDTKDKKKFIPPGVRFIWGSFQFDGLMESLEETLEFFSSEGIPLRASMTMNLTQQKIDQYTFAAEAPSKMPLPGTRPLTAAPSGSTVQGLANSDDWQSVAAANGIENPRNLQAGQLLDMNAGGSVGISASVGFGSSIGISGSAGMTGNVPLLNDIGASANLSVQDSLNLSVQGSLEIE